METIFDIFPTEMIFKILDFVSSLYTIKSLTYTSREIKKLVDVWKRTSPSLAASLLIILNTKPWHLIEYKDIPRQQREIKLLHQTNEKYPYIFLVGLGHKLLDFNNVSFDPTTKRTIFNFCNGNGKKQIITYQNSVYSNTTTTQILVYPIYDNQHLIKQFYVDNDHFCFARFFGDKNKYQLHWFNLGKKITILCTIKFSFTNIVDFRRINNTTFKFTFICLSDATDYYENKMQKIVVNFENACCEVLKTWLLCSNEKINTYFVNRVSKDHYVCLNEKSILLKRKRIFNEKLFMFL